MPTDPPVDPDLTRELIHTTPKVLLHDHLDGGLRPQTVIDLAREAGHADELPTEDPAELGEWFLRGANRGNLALYLEGFDQTIRVMQTAEALRRVAREAIEDVAADNVVYLEIRFAPFFHTAGGLTLEEVMQAVTEGLREGERATGTRWGLIVCGLRSEAPSLSLEMAELAVQHRDRGCVGFDLAGDELGHPAKRHLEAFQYCQRRNFPITVHAGEAFGKDSIWQALSFCGANRIGHCTRLSEDVTQRVDRSIRYGTLAHWIRDRRIPLEMCLSSNVHTGAVATIEAHPFGLFLEQRFRVTLNTDNRLMSGVSMTDELALAAEHFGLRLHHLELLAVNAMKSAFIHYDARCEVISDRIRAGFADIRRANA